MSQQQKVQKVTCKRLMYSIIEYLANLIECPFDISSYLISQNMDDISDVKFSNRKINKWIARNNSSKPDNRLCLVISVDDERFNDISQSHRILEQLLKKFKESFWQSKILDVLENYESQAIIKILSRENYTTLVDYIIIIFNLPNNSSIETVISTNRLSKKNIRRDENGEVIDYNTKLYSDIRKFEQERKIREISNLEDA